MKRIFSLMLFLSCVFSSSPAFSNEFMKVARSCDGEKIYLNPCEIEVTESGIYFEHEGEEIRVESVGQDEEGVFVKMACPACGSPWFLYCSNPDCPLK